MIGFFDSGYGGKTIMNHVVSAMPEYDYIYLGDNYRAPYGNHPPEIIRDLTEQAINHLFDRGVTLIIIACNTATTVALRYLQEKYLRQPHVTDKKILGIVRPTLEEVVKHGDKNIGVIGTRATIESRAYELELKNLNPNIKVHGQPCPLLVPLIEENWHQTPEAKRILKKYLLPLKSQNIDSLILGCTHYSYLYDQVKRIMGSKVKIIDQGPIVAKSLASYLKRHPEIEKLLSKNETRTYLTTGSPERFGTFFTSQEGDPVQKIEQIQL